MIGKYAFDHYVLVNKKNDSFIISCYHHTWFSMQSHTVFPASYTAALPNKGHWSSTGALPFFITRVLTVEIMELLSPKSIWSLHEQLMQDFKCKNQRSLQAAFMFKIIFHISLNSFSEKLKLKFSALVACS